MAHEEINRVRVQNGFCLPTRQKRLRHLHGIAVRNLTYDVPCHDIVNLQTFFSLSNPHSHKELYKSEIITGSLNPTWQTFSIPADDQSDETCNKDVTMRVFAGTHGAFRVIIEYAVHLSALKYLSDKLESLAMQPNTVIFSLFNKYFTIPASSSPSGAASPTVCDVALTVVRVDASAVRTSYPLSSLLRLKTILRAIKQTQTTVTRIHGLIEDRLLATKRYTKKLEARERHIAHIDCLRSELLWQTDALMNEKESANDRALRLHNAKGVLKDDYSCLRKHRDELSEQQKQHNHTRENSVKVNAQLMLRRKQLITDLATYIYPICETKQGETICGIHLADAERLPSRDELSVAVALGYTSHLLSMMSQILDQPLWYAVNANGSRSDITDHIMQKLPYKDRKFPLYWKGKEKLQFDYAVFLLNKNICQLRFHCGLGTGDLRRTLANLRSLLEVRFGVKSPASISSESHAEKTDERERLTSRGDLQTISSANSSPSRQPNVAAMVIARYEGDQTRDELEVSSDDDLGISNHAAIGVKSQLPRVLDDQIHRADIAKRLSDDSNAESTSETVKRVLPEKRGVPLMRTCSFESANNGDVLDRDVDVITTGVDAVDVSRDSGHR